MTIIDILCWIGVGIAALFGLGVLAAVAFVIAMVMNERNH